MVIINDKLQPQDVSLNKALTQDNYIALIGGIVGEKPEAVANILAESGIPVSVPSDVANLSNLLVNNLGKNKTLTKKLAELIQWKAIEVSGSYNKYKWSNADGEGDAPKVTVGSDPVSAIAGAIGSIFEFMAVPSKKKLQQQNMDSIAQIALQTQAQKEAAAAAAKRNSMLLTGGIVLGVLVLGTIITVAVIRSRKG